MEQILMTYYENNAKKLHKMVYPSSSLSSNSFSTVNLSAIISPIVISSSSPIGISKEEDSKLHIVDGGCRTSALIMYKYGNHKITVYVCLRGLAILDPSL